MKPFIPFRRTLTEGQSMDLGKVDGYVYVRSATYPDDIKLKVGNDGEVEFPARVAVGIMPSDGNVQIVNSNASANTVFVTVTRQMPLDAELLAAIGSGEVVGIDAAQNTITQAAEAAHDAAAAATILQAGAVAATAAPTAVGDGDAVRLQANTLGQLVNQPALPADHSDGLATVATTGNTAVVAAPGAGRRLYVHALILTETAAAADAVLIKSASTTRLRVNLAASESKIVPLPVPIRLGDNEALNAALVTGGSASVEVTAVCTEGI